MYIVVLRAECQADELTKLFAAFYQRRDPHILARSMSLLTMRFQNVRAPGPVQLALR
jgi:hypothetical protein